MTLDDNATLSEHMGEFRNYLYYFIGLGVGVLVVNGLLFMVWKYVSRAISKKIRVVCLEHYIRQSVAALEQKNGYEWANNFKMNTLNIEKSIGDKVALLLNLTGIVVSGVIAAVSIRWTLSFQVMMLVPPGILVLLWFISIQIRKREINIEANREAQEKSLETTTMIKTVKMLNGEEKEVADYVTRLEKGEQELDSFSWKLGTSTGIFYLIQYLFFGLGSIMGIQCIRGTSFCPVSITGSRY
jgi:ABC-type multidrug transport system fused ATPase/permease subunit